MPNLWLEFRQYDSTEQLLYGLAIVCTVGLILAVLTKAPKKSAFREWSEAGFTAVWLALAIRILLVEAYSIPSESMVPTLLIKDHLVVSKLSFGWHVPRTEGRILSFGRRPQRGQIVIFVPPHQSKQSFVKRCVGLPGDRIELRGKQVFINGQNAEHPFSYGRMATVSPEAGPLLQKAWMDYSATAEKAASPEGLRSTWLGPFALAPGTYYLEAYPQFVRAYGRLLDQPRAGVLEQAAKGAAMPKSEPGIGQVNWTADQQLGNWDWFGPYTLKEGEYWMMGDNRDNSADSRAFGPVRWEALRGTPLFRYWPPSRMGMVR